MADPNSAAPLTSPKIAMLNYEEELGRIFRKREQLNVSSEAFENAISALLKKNGITKSRRSLSFIQLAASLAKNFTKILLVLLVLTLMFYITLQHKPTQYLIQSKLQDFIYPGMKLLRKISLPFISVYPPVTDLYDESCLVYNPYFQVSDMPCPCDDVRLILNLTTEDVKMDRYHAGIPYIIRMPENVIGWNELKNLYHENTEIFDKDASHVMLSLPNNLVTRKTPSQIFQKGVDCEDNSTAHTHIVWRSNRMEPSRLFRSLFNHPIGEPGYAGGITIEKQVIIDGPKTPPHATPETDGSTVFIMQTSGSRVVVLSPVKECSHVCSVVSVVLPPSHILWYNWWYWRSTSIPAPGSNQLNVAYLGSYL